MRRIGLASMLALSAAPVSAAGEELTGNFACAYAGTWYCAPQATPGGICVDSGGGPRIAKRYTLFLNFDSKRLRLNGLDGHFEPADNQDGYWVYWHIGGLGNAKLSTSVEGSSVRVALVHKDARGSSDSSNFNCTRVREAAL